MTNTTCLQYRSNKQGQYFIYPYIHQTPNVVLDGDQLRGISVPDTVPADVLPSNAEFSMCAGDFVEVYKAQKGFSMISTDSFSKIHGIAL